MSEQVGVKLVKQLRHGQITIPKQFRDSLGIEPDDLLQMKVVGGKLELEPVHVRPRGSSWAKELYELYAPVRASLEPYSDQEIDQAIDEVFAQTRTHSKPRR